MTQPITGSAGLLVIDQNGLELANRMEGNPGTMIACRLRTNDIEFIRWQKLAVNAVGSPEDHDHSAGAQPAEQGTHGTTR
jgi:hypothetical protein